MHGVVQLLRLVLRLVVGVTVGAVIYGLILGGLLLGGIFRLNSVAASNKARNADTHRIAERLDACLTPPKDRTAVEMAAHDCYLRGQANSKYFVGSVFAICEAVHAPCPKVPNP